MSGKNYAIQNNKVYCWDCFITPMERPMEKICKYMLLFVIIVPIPFLVLLTLVSLLVQ